MLKFADSHFVALLIKNFATVNFNILKFSQRIRYVELLQTVVLFLEISEIYFLVFNVFIKFQPPTIKYRTAYCLTR